MSVLLGIFSTMRPQLSGRVPCVYGDHGDLDHDGVGFRLLRGSGHHLAGSHHRR